MPSQYLSQFQPSEKIKFVFTDIDDTLTTDGKLPAESYNALWELYNKGLYIVPITGRPAGWCEMIARFWPVYAVIGENGGFYFQLKENKMNRIFFDDESTRKSNQEKLNLVHEDLLKKMPHIQIASDQFTRSLDLAIDICEDVTPHLNPSEINTVLETFKSHGAIAKVSSIHINGWFGNYDKLKMCKIFLKNEFQLNFEDALDEMIFVGDSPNDEPMFNAFKYSFGVANIQKYIKDLKSPPAFLTPSEGGEGFVEVSKKLL